MDDSRSTGSARREETSAEREDRNLGELLQELRIGGLGVQVLFGFLLSVPFDARFSHLHHAQRELFSASICLAALAIALLTGPVAFHRLVFRQGEKETLIRAANAMAIAGLIVVALAICSAVWLVLSVVLRGFPVPLLVVVIAMTFASLWLLLPLLARFRWRKPAQDADGRR